MYTIVKTRVYVPKEKEHLVVEGIALGKEDYREEIGKFEDKQVAIGEFTSKYKTHVYDDGDILVIEEYYLEETTEHTKQVLMISHMVTVDTIVKKLRGLVLTKFDMDKVMDCFMVCGQRYKHIPVIKHQKRFECCIDLQDITVKLEMEREIIKGFTVRNRQGEIYAQVSVWV